MVIEVVSFIFIPLHKGFLLDRGNKKNMRKLMAPDGQIINNTVVNNFTTCSMQMELID